LLQLLLLYIIGGDIRLFGRALVAVLGFSVLVLASAEEFRKEAHDWKRAVVSTIEVYSKLPSINKALS
jgi:hypothetical protein